MRARADARVHPTVTDVQFTAGECRHVVQDRTRKCSVSRSALLVLLAVFIQQNRP